MLIFIAAFRTDDEEEKFEFVYNRYYKLLLQKAAGILRDYDLAQDAVSEAFIRAYKNLRKLDDLESGETAAFLVMIVKNVSLTMLKKRGRVELIDMQTFDRASAFDLERTVLAGEAADGLLRQVSRLGEELRTPFLLKFAYDLSYQEIAGLLHITANNAAVRVHRARAKLAETLRGEGYGDETD
ncbi:MAG: RNA polymerase sigma factor [Oscillospiraceae bacterium]|nr:RNA polymerase sigma factor [Oscillospiraceae bacterium]